MIIVFYYIYMMIYFSRNKQNFFKIFSFGVIWLIFGITYVVLENGLLGESSVYPTTGNKYVFKNSIIIVSVASFIMGMIQGSIEILWFKNIFKQRSFRKKILFKGLIYLFIVILFIVVLTLISNAIVYKTSLFDSVVIDSLVQFLRTFTFWSLIFYTGLVLDVALFYSEVEDYLGNGIILNYMGKYHHPKQETRIFMFLDMKSSTTIAEHIGHEKYFDLLKLYYADMTNAILETSGEIYQYVGDEIVVSWSETSGLYKNNCLQCFKRITEIFERKKDSYTKQFGLVPEFKAGYHIGEVTTGEIGIIKKNIFHTGDILNTTARIQAECNNYDSKLLISEELKRKLNNVSNLTITKLDSLLLRGKKDAIQLYNVAFK